MARKNKISQADFRRDQIFRDQWGRPYHASVEKETGDPCGLMNPRFDAPVHPPAKYLRIPGSEVEPGRVYVDLDRWEADLIEAEEKYMEQLRHWATTLYGPKAPEAVKKPTAELLSFAGVKDDIMPVEVVRAMKAGNRWILGLKHPETGKPYPMPEWAERLPWFQRHGKKEAPKYDFPDVDESYFADAEVEEDVPPEVTVGDLVASTRGR